MKRVKRYASLLKEWRMRLNRSTPYFFTKITKLGKVCTTVGAGLVGGNAISPHFPEWLLITGAHMATAGFVMVLVAKSVVPEDETKDLPNSKP